MDLSSRQKLQLRWSLAAYCLSLAVVFTLTIPFLVCVIVFNLIAPYNVGDAPHWAYVLLYAWFFGLLGGLVLALSLSFVRCPKCNLLLLGKQPLQPHNGVVAARELVQAFRRRSIQCGRCGSEFSLESNELGDGPLTVREHVRKRRGLIRYLDPPYTTASVALAIVISAGPVTSLLLLEADYPVLSALAALPLLIVIVDAIRVRILYPAIQLPVLPGDADGMQAAIASGAKVIRGHKRCRLVLTILWVGAGGLVIASHSLAWPRPNWFWDFLATVHCHNYFGVGGGAFVWLIFAGAAPMVVIVLAVLMASKGRRILQSGEFPPPGSWVCKDMLVQTRNKAIWRGYGFMAASIVELLLVWYAVHAIWPMVEKSATPFTGDEAACVAKAMKANRK